MSWLWDGFAAFLLVGLVNLALALFFGVAAMLTR